MDIDTHPLAVETDPERKRAQASLIAVAGNRAHYSQGMGIAAILAHQGLTDRARPMEQFAIFGGSTFYPQGGFGDLVGSTDTWERAIEIGRELIDEYLDKHDAFSWWHVVDLYTGEIVYEVNDSGVGTSHYGLQKVSVKGVLSPAGEMPYKDMIPEPVEFKFKVGGDINVTILVTASYRHEAQGKAEKYFGKLPKGEWKPVKGEKNSYAWDSFAFAFDANPSGER